MYRHLPPPPPYVAPPIAPAGQTGIGGVPWWMTTIGVVSVASLVGISLWNSVGLQKEAEARKRLQCSPWYGDRDCTRMSF